MDPLITVPELETYLQRTLDADRALQAVTDASGLVRAFCRWVIAPSEDVTFILDGSGTVVQNLPTMHLTAVEEVRVHTLPLINPEDDASVGDYRWSETGQLQRVDGYIWPQLFRAVQADVTHGYDVTPDAVAAVCKALAASGYSNPEGLRSKTVGGVSRTFVYETMKGALSQLQFEQIGGYQLP